MAAPLCTAGHFRNVYVRYVAGWVAPGVIELIDRGAVVAVLAVTGRRSSATVFANWSYMRSAAGRVLNPLV